MTTRKTWRCFHCGETFRNPRHAAEHFGASEAAEVACKLKSSERSLVQYIRELEDDAERDRQDLHPVLIALASQQSEHAAALQNAEEAGYSRGVRDVRKGIDALRARIDAALEDPEPFVADYEALVRDVRDWMAQR